MVTGTPGAERLSWLRWIDRLSTSLAAAGGVAAIALMLHVVIDVFARMLFNRPLPGTLDVTQFLWMTTTISLGLGYALLRGEHIRVSLLTGPTRPKTQRVIEVASMTFTLVTVAALVWFGVEKAIEATSFGESAVSTPWLAIWPLRWILAVGVAALFLQCFATILRAVAADEFVPSDADETVAALDAEETVFDELQQTESAPDRPRTETRQVTLAMETKH